MSISLDTIITFTLLNAQQKAKETSIQFRLDIIIFKFMFAKTIRQQTVVLCKLYRIQQNNVGKQKITLKSNHSPQNNSTFLLIIILISKINKIKKILPNTPNK